jgi:WD40 repeat protein
MNSNTLSIAVIISFLVISFTMSNDLTAQTNSIRDAEWNHSGTLLAVAYEDHVSIYDSQMNLVTELSSGTRRIIWNNDDTRIAAISTRVRIFDTTNFNEISRFTRDAISDAGEWHPTNSEILALATNEYIQIWNTSNGTLLSEFSGGNYSVDDIEWYSNGTNLIAGSVYPQLAIWDTSQGTITQQFLESYFYAEIIALSPDETLVAFKSDTANLDIWDLTNNSLESTLYTSLGSTTE